VASFNESQVAHRSGMMRCGVHGLISPAFRLSVFMNAAPTRF